MDEGLKLFIYQKGSRGADALVSQMRLQVQPYTLHQNSNFTTGSILVIDGGCWWLDFIKQIRNRVSVQEYCENMDGNERG